DSDLGDHLFSVRLVVTGDDELTLTDNVVEGVRVRVDAPELFIAEHFTWPNPANDLRELNFEYRLSREMEGSVTIEIFDLLGQNIATTTMVYDADPSSPNEGVLPGMNTVSWESFDATDADLASGVYIYRVMVYGDYLDTDPADQVMGKFAIVR
ncbi:hypothetical protein KAW64_13085, partial [bacterium]|nr:hypothetical protein [bacterium]